LTQETLVFIIILWRVREWKNSEALQKLPNYIPVFPVKTTVLQHSYA